MNFMQIHTFYGNYLSDFYTRNNQLIHSSFTNQIAALLRDGFSASHMIAPYLKQLDYDSHLIIANCSALQFQWLIENNIDRPNSSELMKSIVKKQVDYIRPDILYLSDPISFDDTFIQMLDHKPLLIIGWRAAPYFITNVERQISFHEKPKLNDNISKILIKERKLLILVNKNV